MNSPARPLDLLARRPPASLPAKHDKPIGAILMDAELILREDVDRIIAHGQKKNLRFGDAAVALGLVKPDVLRQALAFQFDYPVVAPGTSLISREVMAAYDNAEHPVLDDLRALRNQIQLLWLAAEDRANRTIAVLSPGRGDGRSFLAANLAVTFSQMGQRTLLIDADMRHPRQHDLFGLPSDAGLSAMLAERAVTTSVHRLRELRDLSIIPCGGLPPNATDLLSRDSFHSLLTTFEGLYDVVIVDTPAAAEGPEAQMVASRARGCVMVARQGVTEFKAVSELAAGVKATGVTVIGSALMLA